MKYFFLFLLLLPSVAAIAVTPTAVVSDENGFADVLVINNLEEDATYRLLVGKTSEEIFLEPGDSYKFHFFLPENVPFILIEEEREGSLLVHALKLSASSEVYHTFNLETIAVTPQNQRSPYFLEKIIFIGILFLLLTLFISYFIKKKK